MVVTDEPDTSATSWIHIGRDARVLIRYFSDSQVHPSPVHDREARELIGLDAESAPELRFATGSLSRI